MATKKTAARRKLPKKLSDGILVALDDYRWVERQKNIGLDMSTFINTRTLKSGQTCTVCLGGAVLYRDLGVREMVAYDTGILVSRNAITMAESKKINALDFVRVGSFENAADDWYDGKVPARAHLKLMVLLNSGGMDENHSGNHNTPEGRKEFKKYLKESARKLAAIGL